jgi:hypothetical protein
MAGALVHHWRSLRMMAGAFARGVNDFYCADDDRPRHGFSSECQTRNNGKAQWMTECGGDSTFELFLTARRGALCMTGHINGSGRKSDAPG